MAIVGIGGMPTDVDVERLRQEIGVPEPGQAVTYSKLEDVLKVPRTKSRFMSVVSAWRKRLYRENNVLLKAIPNTGYEAMDSHGRVDFGVRTYKRGLRRIHRATDVAVRTDRRGLDAEEVRALDHVALVGAQLRLTAATKARELRYPDLQVQALAAPQG